MNAREIKNELEDLLDQIDLQIEEVKRWADEEGFEATQMRNTDGNYTMIPLLVAKAQTLTALGSLRPTIVNTTMPTPTGRIL